MSAETRRRWRTRLEINHAELEALLNLLLADAKICRQYRHEVEAMLKQERAVCLSQAHFFYARPIQLAVLTNLYTTQFTTWFNVPQTLPRRTIRRLLTSALGMEEDDLIAALYKRQQHSAAVKQERDLIDRYLSERSW